MSLVSLRSAQWGCSQLILIAKNQKISKIRQLLGLPILGSILGPVFALRASRGTALVVSVEASGAFVSWGGTAVTSTGGLHGLCYVMYYGNRSCQKELVHPSFKVISDNSRSGLRQKSPQVDPKRQQKGANWNN